MSQIIAAGIQSYETLINNDYMYVDKTDFIQEWWENGDAVTMITRPRRFGKTLMMDMCNCFFQMNIKEEKIYLKVKKFFKMKNTKNCKEHILFYIYHLPI